jgi:enamine deaminase RidA (YjgF/YER057c/UK114 family)
MIEEKLASIGISLSSPPKPIGSYVPVMQSGNLLFVSGQIPLVQGTLPEKYKGKIPSKVSMTDAVEGARQCTINGLEQINKFLGNLERITKFVKITGYVNCDTSFKDHPKVINGASDFLLEIFGEKGKHTRVAVGASSIPLDSVVEVDIVCEVY